MSVDLKTIQYPVAATKKDRNGKQKPISPEDLFMRQNLNPGCHSKCIKNDYFLTIRCDFDGCVCCAKTPYAKVPLTIIPVVNPKCFGF